MLSPRSTLRFGFRYRFEEEIEDPVVANLLNDGYIQQVDSEKSHVFYFRPGYDYQFGQKKINYYIGADLLLGYCRCEVLSDRTRFEEVSEGNFGEDIFFEDFDRLQSHELRVGISPLLGINFPLTKRISLTAFTSVDFFFRQSWNTPSTEAGEQAKTSDAAFEWAKTAIMNDFSIQFHF